MTKYTLVIDPGHEGDLSGQDPGAVSKFGKEADYTLQISRYQYNRFKALGVTVNLTRDEPEKLSQDTRVRLAQEGVYCISNHLNAGGGDRAEVIHSIYDNGRLAEYIKKELLAAGQNAVKIYTRKSGSSDYYYMHRRTGITKTNIVEYCFIDNAADFKHFKDNMYDYAEAVVKAFCNFIGHKYTAPGTTQAPSKPAAAKPTPAAPAPKTGTTHAVKRGDTLYGIAKAYGVTVAQLKSWNDLKNDTILVGEKLQVSKAAYHTVVRGDTVSGLAKKYGSSLSEIKNWNSLDSKYTIRVGQRLRVK